VYSSLHSLLEENTDENTETNKNIMRMDDLLIFMMLDEHKKMYRNVAVRIDSYAERTFPRLCDLGYQDLAEQSHIQIFQYYNQT